MKILMINKFLHPNGGSETYIFKLGEQLVRMGHQVQYFGMEHEGRVVGNHAESYTSDMDFHTGGLGKLAYPFKIIYSLEARRRLRAVLQDVEPDVVHLNNFNFQLTPSILYEVRSFSKKRGKKIPMLYTAHDYQWVCPNHMLMVPGTGRKCFDCRGGRFSQCTKNRCIHGSRVKSLLGSLEGYFYRMLGTYRLVDRIICPSEFLNRQLSTNPLLAEKTLTLHNFVDAEPALQGRRRKETECGENAGGRGYVLYFGRYSEEKGIGTLLQACEQLPEIPFVFAGSGPLKEKVDRLSNVEDKGFLSEEELRPLIAGASFTVFPSQWYENCPFTVMESQICGTPVLASNIGGTPELIRNGQTGELFEAGDAGQLTQAIRKLWEEPLRTEEYAKNCAEKQFDTVEEYCGKLVALYQECERGDKR